MWKKLPHGEHCQEEYVEEDVIEDAKRHQTPAPLSTAMSNVMSNKKTSASKCMQRIVEHHVEKATAIPTRDD